MEYTKQKTNLLNTLTKLKTMKFDDLPAKKEKEPAKASEIVEEKDEYEISQSHVFSSLASKQDEPQVSEKQSLKPLEAQSSD